MQAANPKVSVTIDGKKLGLLFDVNSNPTKKGIKLHFVLDKKEMDPREKQALASKISVTLQKKFGAAGIVIDYDERSPYENAISYIVPIQSISDILLKALKS
jgi:sporulation protein YlmC with PRC-barrel domain